MSLAVSPISHCCDPSIPSFLELPNEALPWDSSLLGGDGSKQECPARSRDEVVMNAK